MALAGAGQKYLWTKDGGGEPPGETPVLRFEYRFYPVIVFLIWLFN